MNNFKEITKFLEDNNLTKKDLDNMWNFMYEHNWKIKSLTDCGKDWSDLNIMAVQSLIKNYNEQLSKEVDENE